MNLEEAVRSFSLWEQPWKFESYVKDVLGKSQNDLLMFEEIMSISGEQTNWLFLDLAEGYHFTVNRLKSLFPDIEPFILESAARASSYSWK